MTNRDKAYDLMCKIRYNMASGIHTYSPCSTKGCEEQSRSGEKCANCLIEELAGIVGDPLGYGFAGAVDAYNKVMDAVLRRAEVLDANK